MSQLLTADRPLACRAGDYLITLSIVGPSAYRVEVFSSGPVRQTIDSLTRSFDDEQLARHIATVITMALRNDGATAADGIRAVAAYLDDIIGRLAQHKGVEVAEAVAEFQALRAGFEVPSGLAALKPAAARQVRMTMGGAQNADLAQPQRDALAVARLNGGTVLRSKDNPLPVLRALARKGFGDLNYAANAGRRRIVESLTLNGRGWSEAVAR